MSWRLTAQSCGSFMVVGAFAASETAAHYLAAHPGSGLAWRLSLEVFRPFELARSGASPLRVLFGPASLWIALAALAAIVACHVRGLRWGVAAFANLSFVFALFLAGAWSGGLGGARSAALGGVASVSAGQDPLVRALLLVSFLSVALSHLSFLGRIAEEAALGRRAQGSAKGSAKGSAAAIGRTGPAVRPA